MAKGLTEELQMEKIVLWGRQREDKGERRQRELERDRERGLD